MGEIRRRQKWKRRFRSVRANLIALLVLAVLGVVCLGLLRTALLKNAQNSGTALARSYASEEQNNLTVYETLMNFGSESLSRELENGGSGLREWLQVYFEQLQAVLGEGIVDPYLVYEGKILGANPWEGDATYDPSGTQWYQKAMEAGGDVVFTNVYTDAIYHRPVITVAQRCGDAEAVLAFDIFPENFQFETSFLNLPEEASFYLCDSAGNLIYSQTELDVSSEAFGRYLESLLNHIESGSQDRYDSSFEDMDGRERAVYYSFMTNGWIAVITIPYASILETLRAFSAALSLIFLVIFAVIGIMTWRDLKFNDRMERTNETVRVLGNSYYALYRVDFGQDTYEMIKGSDYVRSRIPQQGKYEELLRVMGEVIEKDAYEEYMESFSLKNIEGLVARRVRNFGGDFLRRFGDAYRWVSVRVLFDESLAPEEVVLCFREVEQEKQQQLQERKLLEDALESSRQSERSKEAFFSNMSHDMRTPLNAIIGLSQLAGQALQEPEKIKGYIEKINISSKQLLGLINDILDMSKMESGKVVFNNQQFDLRECVEESLISFRLQADRENKTLRTEFLAEDPVVMGDPFRISQIINNLASNAFKFTSAGDTVSVSVTQVENQEYAKYKIVVKDTGIGMSKEFLPQLFEPYARETRFSARQTAGTGLGMSIVKSLVSQMNGQIFVESELGKGTVFTLILPFTAVKESQVQEQGEKEPLAEGFSLEGKKILLAEDNPINMEIAAEILSMNGAKITQAWNGREALEAFESSQAEAFDAILMDMQMPEMDGCEAARRIRNLARPDAAKIPIIAVTANAFAEDIAATAEAGMNAHISKPIDFQILCQTLEKLIAGRGNR